MSAARLGREPRRPAPPSPTHCHPSCSRLAPPAPAHLSVSCFDDECFGSGQGAGPQLQPHPPQGLPPEQQQGEPRQHPDHGVIAEGSPWAATVAAEPLQAGQGQGSWAGWSTPTRSSPPLPVHVHACSVTSDSLRPPRSRLQPARLLCPWDFPGRNTGAGCQVPFRGIFPTQGSNPRLPRLPPRQAGS